MTMIDLSPLALNALERALCAAERDRAREVAVSTETLRALVDAKTAGQINESMEADNERLREEIDNLNVQLIAAMRLARDEDGDGITRVRGEN